MRPTTQHEVDTWWAEVFAIEHSALWHETTVRPHAILGDFAGWFVAFRDDGVHVSAPTDVDEDLLGQLLATHPEALRSTAFWSSFADECGGLLRGPATHAYLDVDPGTDPEVHHVIDPDLDHLRSLVTPEEWEESGLGDDDVEQAFVLEQDHHVVAVAVLAPWRGGHLDIGILVAPDLRGTGQSDRVARTAASYALRERDFVRWVARQGNHGSAALSRRLGFEPWCTQLAVRL